MLKTPFVTIQQSPRSKFVAGSPIQSLYLIYCTRFQNIGFASNISTIMAESQQLSRDEARKHIEKIATKGMYLDEDEFSGLSKTVQNVIVEGRKWKETCGNLTET
jgi:hypothetical protein